MMRDRTSWLAVGGVLVLVLIGAVWALGGFEGLSPAGGFGVTFGIVVAIAIGITFMAIVLRGRRSRRDEAVRREIRRDGF